MLKILCIRPYDDTTKFLERIPNRLTMALGDVVETILIAPKDEAHHECLKIIEGFDPMGTIVFLGHGTKEYLQGAVYRDIEGKKYTKKEYISHSNIEVFKEKKVFCLSCHSANGLGEAAISIGAKVFVGFGELPTDLDEFDEDAKPVQRIINDFKGIIQEVVKESLVYGVLNNCSFNHVISHLRLLLNKKHAEIIINHTGKRERRRLAELIHQMKTQVKVFGDGDIKLLG